MDPNEMYELRGRAALGRAVRPAAARGASVVPVASVVAVPQAARAARGHSRCRSVPRGAAVRSRWRSARRSPRA